MSRTVTAIGCFCLVWSGVGLALHPLQWWDLVHVANIFIWTKLFCDRSKP